MKNSNKVINFIKKHWFLTLAVLSFTLFCVYAKILDAMEPRYINSEMYSKIYEYRQSKGISLNQLADKLLEVPAERYFGIDQHVNRNYHEMWLVHDSYDTDTLSCKKEIFGMYKDCFNIDPTREVGPILINKKLVVEVIINFGYNCCDIIPHLLYTKLDTTELKSRYPSLPYYPKESQPKDSECTYIWELDNNWYIIAN